MTDDFELSRDLLFGLLALQNQMVTLEDLIGAIQGSAVRDSTSLEEFLLAQGCINPRRARLIGELVTEHLEIHGNVSSQSLSALAVDAVTREKLIQAMSSQEHQTFRLVLESTAGERTTTFLNRSGGEEAATMLTHGERPRVDAFGTTDRYRILKLHAQGGLGAVYLAEDRELNREVALKQILENHADDLASRARFVLEAEITGKLEHPGIVPVYGLGSYDDGRPYYAMRFIHGGSMKEVIDGFHQKSRRGKVISQKEAPPQVETAVVGSSELELRKLLRRFVDVCNAVEYAHSRGVLHRDIKPGNVIVGRHGETLVVDWGLAKQLGSSAASTVPDGPPIVGSSGSGSVETLPGSAMGTPAYMSPEQARGDLAALGPTSDVYSLGATLYSILTGKPPFEGHPSKVLHHVVKGEFPAPRTIAPATDPALEAVCLKAMAKEIGDRYPTCKELIEDVERWMADEPVTAWPEPWRRRAGRWARRHRTVVVAAAALLLTATCALGLGAYRISLERNAANQARFFAENDFLVARNTVNQFLLRMGDAKIMFVPQLEPMRRDFLRAATQSYEQLLIRRMDDNALRKDTAAAYRKLANIERVTGRITEAMTANSDARRHLDALLLRDPQNSEAAVERAIELAEEGDLLRLIGRYRDAEVVLKDAQASARVAEGLLTDPGEAGNLTGIALMRTAALADSFGRREEALSLYREAAERLRKTAGRPSPDGTNKPPYLIALRGYATQLRRIGRSDQASQAITEALLQSQQASELHPDNSDLTYQHALDQAEHGRIAVATRKDDAIRSLDRSIATLKALHEGFPNSLHYAESLSDASLDRGRVVAEAAGPDLDRALQLAAPLSERMPHLPRYRRLLGIVHLARGEYARNQKDSQAAGESFRKARAALDAALKAAPEDALTKETLQSLDELERRNAP